MSENTLYEMLTPSSFEARLKAAPIAYLPLGTLEWHGPHLPLGSDHLQSQRFFLRLADRVGGIVLPPLFLGPDSFKTVEEIDFYGMDFHQKEYPHPVHLKGSAYWIPDDLFSSLLDAIFKQLRRAGFRILVAHGHGPSTNFVIRNQEILEEKHNLKIFTLWRSVGERDKETEFQYDHAAANETSIMMALHPQLVHMEYLSKDLTEKPLAIIGRDPRTHASPEYGQRIIDMHLDRMVSLLSIELERISKV